MDEGGGLNSVYVSGEQTGILQAPAVQGYKRGQSTQTKDSDLTKWAVNDSHVPDKIT